jgi:hypothetical protein
VHAALICDGPNRGRVLLWDYETLPVGQTPSSQRWSIVDPELPQGHAMKFQNYNLPMPSGVPGDLFCAGHAWTRFGTLLVAGGTALFPPPGFLGAKIVYVYDPLFAGNQAWTRLTTILGADRWYPTVITMGNDQLLVAGGNTAPGNDTYEAATMTARNALTWQLNGASQLWPGPGAVATAFDVYPRMHHLSTGRTFVSDMPFRSARVNHVAAPGVWQANGVSVQRSFGTSVLWPSQVGGLRDFVIIAGGDDDGCNVWDTVQYCNAAAATAGPPALGGWDWTSLPSMNIKRTQCSGVLLPDGKVLVLGGRKHPRIPPARRGRRLGRRWLARLRLHDLRRGTHGLPTGSPGPQRQGQPTAVERHRPDGECLRIPHRRQPRCQRRRQARPPGRSATRGSVREPLRVPERWQDGIRGAGHGSARHADRDVPKPRAGRRRGPRRRR